VRESKYGADEIPLRRRPLHRLQRLCHRLQKRARGALGHQPAAIVFAATASGFAQQRNPDGSPNPDASAVNEQILLGEHLAPAPVATWL